MLLDCRENHCCRARLPDVLLRKCWQVRNGLHNMQPLRCCGALSYNQAQIKNSAVNFGRVFMVCNMIMLQACWLPGIYIQVYIVNNILSPGGV